MADSRERCMQETKGTQKTDFTQGGDGETMALTSTLDLRSRDHTEVVGIASIFQRGACENADGVPPRIY